MQKNTRVLLGDIRSLIEKARQGVARAIDTGLVLLYWHIGKRVREDILNGKRADYGEQIVVTLSRQLTSQYGSGYSSANLFKMVQFNEVFPNRNIVQALSGQLGWSHFVALLSMEDDLKRNFYAEMCRVENWSVRVLREKIA